MATFLMWAFFAYIGILVWSVRIGIKRGLRSARTGNTPDAGREKTKRMNAQREWAAANQQAANRIRNM